MQWIYHWLYLDLWCPIWPNLAASLIVYVFVWWKLHTMQKLHEELREIQLRHHRELKQAIGKETGTS